MRLLVIGIGAGIWQFHRPAVGSIGARVVGVHDVDSDRAQAAAAELGCRAAGDLDELLTVDADVALILAPHPLHAELTLACLRAGLHVLVEKPMAITPAQADRMVEAAVRAGRMLAVCLQHRTRPEVVEAGRILRAGLLGDLRRADLLATWPRRTSYFRTAAWRGTWAGEGGGILINQGHHDLDLLCHLAGLPASVIARTRAAMHPIETEDTAHGLLEWDGGALGSIHISTAEADEAQRLELTGTRGRLRLLPGRLEFWRGAEDFREYAAAAGDPYAPPSFEHLIPVAGEPPDLVSMYRALYRNLVAALAGSEPLIAPAHEAARTVELTASLIMAGQLGTPVTPPLDRAAYTQLVDGLAQARPAAGAEQEARA